MDPRELLPGEGEAPSSNPEEWECNGYGVHHARVAFNICDLDVMAITSHKCGVDLMELGIGRCRHFAAETVAKVLETIAGGPPFAIRMSDPTSRKISMSYGPWIIIEITIFAWNLQDIIQGLDTRIDPAHLIGTSAPNIAFLPMAREFIQKNIGGMYAEYTKEKREGAPIQRVPTHYEGVHVDAVWSDEIGPERSLPKGG